MANDRGSVAVPTCYGDKPIAVLSLAEFDPSQEGFRRQALPTLSPNQINASFKIRVAGKGVWIDLPQEAPINDADANFLVRWWVAGKPVAHGKSDRMPIVQEALRADEVVSRAYLEMDFVPERIGARPGDRVALQILYKRWEWHFLQDSDVPDRHVFSTTCYYGKLPLTLVSNRVEWIVP